MCLQFVLRATVINITIQRKYYQVTNNLIFSMPTILGIHIKLLKYFQHFQCEITGRQLSEFAVKMLHYNSEKPNFFNFSNMKSSNNTVSFLH